VGEQRLAWFSAKGRDVSWLTDAAKGIKALAKKKEIPDNLWRKCPSCADVLYHRELERNHWVCASCGHHLPLNTQ